MEELLCRLSNFLQNTFPSTLFHELQLKCDTLLSQVHNENTDSQQWDCCSQVYQKHQTMELRKLRIGESNTGQILDLIFIRIFGQNSGKANDAVNILYSISRLGFDSP